MTQSTYAWMGSRLHLVLDDDFAAAYNRATDAFSEAQIHHRTRTGSSWTSNEPLEINVKPEELAAFNKVADLINLLCEINGGSLDIKEDDITSDYLVKVE